MNNLISSILFNSKTKFVYSNGMSINEHITNDNCKFIFEDCKEGRYHVEYFPQYTSVCIYKGNKYYNECKREIFKNELPKEIVIQDGKIVKEPKKVIYVQGRLVNIVI